MESKLYRWLLWRVAWNKIDSLVTKLLQNDWIYSLVISRGLKIRIHALHANNQLMSLFLQTFSRSKFTCIQPFTIRTVDWLGRRRSASRKKTKKDVARILICRISPNSNKILTNQLAGSFKKPILKYVIIKLKFSFLKVWLLIDFWISSIFKLIKLVLRYFLVLNIVRITRF